MDFLITMAFDGSLKFWKKNQQGIEFIKHFQAHTKEINDFSVSSDSSLLCTVGDDQTFKIFDIAEFDMINITKLDHIPVTCEWIYGKGDQSRQEFAVTYLDKNFIHIFDKNELESGEPIKTIDDLHFAPISKLIFNAVYKIAMSIDQSGLINFWSNGADQYKFPESFLEFELNSDTDYFEFVTTPFKPVNASISPNGIYVAILTSDCKVIAINIFSHK